MPPLHTFRPDGGVLPEIHLRELRAITRTPHSGPGGARSTPLPGPASRTSRFLMPPPSLPAVPGGRLAHEDSFAALLFGSVPPALAPRRLTRPHTSPPGPHPPAHPDSPGRICSAHSVSWGLTCPAHSAPSLARPAHSVRPGRAAPPAPPLLRASSPQAVPTSLSPPHSPRHSLFLRPRARASGSSPPHAPGLPHLASSPTHSPPADLPLPSHRLPRSRLRPTSPCTPGRSLPSCRSPAPRIPGSH